MLPTMRGGSSLLSYFRDDFRMETWLLAGACLQAVGILLLGQRSLIITAVLLGYQLGAGLLKDQGLFKSNQSKNVKWGKWTMQFPRRESDAPLQDRSPSDEEIVVFMLASRSNHPRGRFAPGFIVMGKYFGDMWRDLAKNRQTNGFLGKTSTLMSTDEDCSNTMCWLSYWKDMESLQAFANGPVHKKGLVWYMKTALKEYPGIGIMHETYHIPKGHWETIMFNMRPFGLTATQHFVDDKDAGEKRPVSAVIEAKGKTWDKMRDRMGTSDSA